MTLFEENVLSRLGNEAFQRLHCCLVPLLLIRSPLTSRPHAQGSLTQYLYHLDLWATTCINNKLPVLSQRRVKKINPSAEDSLHGPYLAVGGIAGWSAWG